MTGPGTGNNGPRPSHPITTLREVGLETPGERSAAAPISPFAWSSCLTAGGAVYWPRGERAALIIDPRLSRSNRYAALAHELVHDERGGGADHAGMPPSCAPVVARDEAAVDNEVARRLVPLDELVKFCEVVVLLDLGVTALATWPSTSTSRRL